MYRKRDTRWRVLSAALRARFERCSSRRICRRVGRDPSSGIRGNVWADGCPLATVTFETAHSSDVLGKVCGDAFKSWLDVLTASVSTHGLAQPEAHRLAVVVLAGIEGHFCLPARNANPNRSRSSAMNSQRSYVHGPVVTRLARDVRHPTRIEVPWTQQT